MKLSKKKGFREFKTRPCGEGSPYWNWLQTHGKVNPEGELIEFAESNPDVLSEDQHLYKSRLSETERDRLDAIHEAWNKLSKRERMVLSLCGNEGKSIEEASSILGISRESIKTYLFRASKKVEKVYKSLCHHYDGFRHR